MGTPAVALRNVTRRFGSLVANRDVTLELEAGEVHALVGENGAGKTTLMRILYGLIAPDSGRIERDGRTVRIRRPADAMRHGLGMVHQHFMLVDTLTTAENVTLGREPRGPAGSYNREKAEHEVAELSRRFGLPTEPGQEIRSLSVGAQQRVEILKALYHGARVLILDEPTAVLTPQEVDELFQVLRGLKAEGTTILIITHKLAEVQAIADHVTVMRAGSVVGSGPIATMPPDRIGELMMGKSVVPPLTRATRPTGRPLLEVVGLEAADDRALPALRGVSFQVRAGEIVGIAGVEGNGQHELAECLSGLRPWRAGEIRIAGHRCHGRSAREHSRAGLAHIPSDRLKRGLVPDMTLAENLVLGLQRTDEMPRGPWLDPGWLETRAAPRLVEFDVRPPTPRALAGQLSGGNQQKLIAARELNRGASVVLAAHPTRGLDLGAIAFLHARLLAERNQDRAILLVSSDLSEILALSDRILVLFEGRIVHETHASATDERALGLYMTGRTSDAGAA